MKRSNTTAQATVTGDTVGAWFVYILHCADATLYTGITNNLQKRLAKHQSGKGARYTQGRLPIRLVYQETCIDKSSALKREYAIKQLERIDKLKLTRGIHHARHVG